MVTTFTNGMTEDKAQQLIVLAAAITIGSTVSGLVVYPKHVAEARKEIQKQEEKEVHEKKKKTTSTVNTHRAIVGGFFAMAGCSVIASFAPDAGVGIAALVAGGAFFFYGLPVLENYFLTPKELAAKEGKKK